MHFCVSWQVLIVILFYGSLFFIYHISVEKEEVRSGLVNSSNSIYYISQKYFNIYDAESKNRWKDTSVCLFVSLYHKSQGYISAVMNNYDIFWPSNIGKKVILLDKESEYMESYITNKWEIHYEEYNVNGVVRRQYSSYIAHRYCSPNKFIAFMDSDSIFSMKVAKYMLFDENNKPYFLYTKKIRYREWNPSKLLKLMLTEWGDGMITFPVIVYTEHIASLYNYLIKIHNNTLENIIAKYYSSQFCVFLEYVKHFYKNEYNFAVYEDKPILRCGFHVPYAYNITKLQIRDKVKLFDFNVVINTITYDGLCSIFVEKYPHKCSKYNRAVFYYRFYIIDDFKHSLPDSSKNDILLYNQYKDSIITTVDMKTGGRL